MDNTDYCSYELARKLKECGFDLPCWEFYIKDFKLPCTEIKPTIKPKDWNNILIGGSKKISAPTLWEAQKWLREERSVDIYVIPRYQNAYEVVAKRLGKRAIDTFFVFDLWDSKKPYPTYETALSAGISAALKLMEEVS